MTGRIIVAGHITAKAGKRDDFLAASLEAVIAARAADGCKDFAVSADLVESNRVNVFESWETREQLDAFRKSGPSESMMTLVETAAVREYVVKSDI